MTTLSVPQFNGKAHSKIQALAKPIGAVCNIDCTYCYYLGKQELLDYSSKEKPIMSDELLDTYIKQYIEGQNTPEIIFSWHGGEPTLLGVEYFKKVMELQKKYCPDYSTISNDLQTNGTLLTDEWCLFFKANAFIVGVSIDGPEALHNHHRTNKAGRGTFNKTMRGIRLLQKHQVNFATLTCVNDVTSKEPLAVYKFLRDDVKSPQMQFIPVVDKVAASTNGKWLEHGHQSIIPVQGAVESWSVEPSVWGDFLVTVFDEWFANDFGNVMIPYFENFFGVWMGKPSTMCTLNDICGKGIAVEPNGDVYSCDHYVYPEFKIGNITDRPLSEMAFSTEQQHFGFAKQKSLPNQCKQCDYLFACHGECPKNRINTTKEGEFGLNYLCSGWMRFFTHVDPILSTLIENNGLTLRKGI